MKKIKNITSDAQADDFFKDLGLEKEDEKSMKAQFSKLRGKVSERKVLDFLKRNPILIEKFLRFSIEDKDCGDEKLNRLESTHPQVVEQIHLLRGSSIELVTVIDNLQLLLDVYNRFVLSYPKDALLYINRAYIRGLLNDPAFEEDYRRADEIDDELDAESLEK